MLQNILFIMGHIQSVFSRLSQGLEDDILECSLGWWADAAATYCPGRPSEIAMKSMTKLRDRRGKNALQSVATNSWHVQVACMHNTCGVKLAACLDACTSDKQVSCSIFRPTDAQLAQSPIQQLPLSADDLRVRCSGYFFRTYHAGRLLTFCQGFLHETNQQSAF